MARRAAPRATKARGCALVLLPALVPGASAQELVAPWPDCQEKGRVLRHNGAFGIFVDLTAVGAKDGCWLSDCTKTDKFVCPRAADCAEACAKIEACKFWTYEPGIVKCFMRSSDAGREENADFVSGSRACRPSAGVAAMGTGVPPALGAQPSLARARAPFARAALWAAELPALRPCDGGVGAQGCENPYVVMGVWRYAINNLRMAVSKLPDTEKAQHRSTLQYVQQIAQDVAVFYQQPTPETFQMAVSNANAVFSALRGWLQSAPPSDVEVPATSKATLPEKLPKVADTRDGLGTVRRRLANGREMPMVGFGTWQLMGQAAYDATLTALRAGYRHIDTAQAYGNEREIGFAIRDSGVPRSELFLATKLSDPAEFPRLAERLQVQLAELGTDHLDLYMLHTPSDKAAMESAWRAMEQMFALGKVRSLGVSNFGVSEMEDLMAFAQVKPVYVQNKFSVYNPGEQMVGPRSILAYTQANGIQVMGYSVMNPWPLVLPPMEDPHVLAVASRYGRTPAQILHRWALQLGVAVIPKSGTAARIQENAQILDFELMELDMRLLSGLVCLSETLTGQPLAPAWADDVYGIGSLPALA